MSSSNKRGSIAHRIRRAPVAAFPALTALTVLSACGTTVSGSDQQVFVFSAPIGASINVDLSGKAAAPRRPDAFAPVPSPLSWRAGSAGDGAARSVHTTPPANIDVAFAPGSAHLDAAAKRELVALAVALLDPALEESRFLIAGHTDASGDAARNRALSQERAEAVRAFLVDPGGVDPLRLVARGYGSDFPIDPADPRSGANRRIEISRL